MKQLLYLFVLITSFTTAQIKHTVQGNFSNSLNKEIILKKYNFNRLEEITATQTDVNGKFKLEYPDNYVGAALIEIKDTKSVIVLLNKEDFELQWEDINDFKTLKFINSPENDNFNTGMEIYKNSEAKKSGLKYLIPLYEKENQKIEFLSNEINIQNNKMSNFINELSEKKYSKYYLKIRKLIADFKNVNNKTIQEIEFNIKEFNSLNFNDANLINSGLYIDLIETYTVFMENNSDSKFEELKKSIDSILNSIISNPSLKQELAEQLFNFLEKRSLTSVSEYIALKMLSQTDCKIEAKQEALFEQYRKMAIGKTAPIIDLSKSNKPMLKYESINNKYKLIVFGASWCQKCTEEIPKLKTFYSNWKAKNDLEIIFISLDNELSKYKDFTKNYAWISSCDLKGWEGTAARDYFVSATPTMFLLDKKNTILLKPISPEQIESWFIANQK